MSKKRAFQRVPIKRSTESDPLKVATFPILGISNKAAMERYMTSNFGLTATSSEDLPEGKPSEEYLIDFKVEKKTR